MTTWLDRLRGKTAEPARLHGAPSVLRLKNYAAASGYAYEYVYAGMRDLEGGREYVFRVSGDRKTWFHLSIVVATTAVDAWQRTHGRQLADNERYAIAKMALFTSFDERTDPQAMREPVHVDAAQVEQHLSQVGIE